MELTQLWFHLNHYGPGFLFEQQLVVHAHASLDGAGRLRMGGAGLAIRVLEAELTQLLPLDDRQLTFRCHLLE